MTTTMVDTFGISVPMPFPHHLSKRDGWIPGGIISNDWETIDDRTLKCTDLIGTAEVIVRFLESNYHGFSQMNIQVSSLPKAFDDNNFIRSTNLQDDFIEIGSLIQEAFVIPQFDIFSGHLFRVDLAAVF